MSNFETKSCLIKIKGLNDLIVHSVEHSLNPRNQWSKELSALAKKKGTNKTIDVIEKMAYLETKRSLWYADDEYTTLEIPPRVLRAVIEAGARKVKAGPQVREGLMVTECIDFSYPFEDVPVDDLCQRSWNDPKGGLQFETPVVVKRSKVMRVRARFQRPWSATFRVEFFSDLLDEVHLEEWLKIAGIRLGIGDWRPEKSGIFGRFDFEVQ